MVYFATKTLEGWKWQSSGDSQESFIEKFANNLSELARTAFAD